MHRLMLLFTLSMINYILLISGIELTDTSTISVLSEPVDVTTGNNSLPGCKDKCGNVSIPYPFGIGAGCYVEGFDITCNDFYDPPKPFIGNTMFELLDITLHQGQVRVYEQIAWVCFNKTDLVNYGFQAFDLKDRNVYTISEDNMFTAIGCCTSAIIQLSENQMSGCMSICSSLESVQNGTCSSEGCCQIAMPKGISKIFTYFSYDVNNTLVWDFNPCSYAFIVQKGWFDNFSSSDLVGQNFLQKNKRGFPIVLDWSIGNKTCEEAKRDLSSYRCVDSNSECFNSTNGAGYFCNCSKGFEGNPYIYNACADIDECQNPTEYPCYGNCFNTVGSYNCTCPHGTSGDPTIKNGCVQNKYSLPWYFKIIIGIAVAVFCVAFISFWIYLGQQKRKLILAKQLFFSQNGGFLLQQQMNSYKSNTAFRIFTEEELQMATNKFSFDRIIGRGGHGIVYKGILDDNTVIAVKKSKFMDENQKNEFAKEMFILSQINHKNVIKLLGCCLEVEVPILVYEFVSNGCLSKYIHNKHLSIPLVTRLQIAAESAYALSYLHSSASPPIIHGDVKPSNILLDEEYTPKVSDFGSSKFAPKDSNETTLIQGTFGYLDPEYLSTNVLTEKSDVYSFGVVILELLTRKKIVEYDECGTETNLVTTFISAMNEEKLIEVLDEVKEDIFIIEDIAKITERCLKKSGGERPTMKEVADILEKALKCKLQNVGSSKKSAHDQDFTQKEPEDPLNELANASENIQTLPFDAQALFSLENGR